MTQLRVERYDRAEDERCLPALLWRAGPGWTMVATTVLGGGLGPREWVLNAQVPHGYARLDPAAHLAELAEAAGLRGPGVGMLTAATVTDAGTGTDGGVRAWASVGLGRVTWAAAPDQAPDAPPAGAPGQTPADAVHGRLVPPRAGTVNVVVAVPVPLTDGALVNAVATATEAKAQALLELGLAGTGTASDAVCVAAPAVGGASAAPPWPPEPFAGPRSTWGARAARAVHAAVTAGTRRYLQRHPAR